MNVKITGSGADDVILGLDRLVLETHEGKRLRKCLKRAAMPLVAAMKARCHVKTGDLQKSLGVRAIRTRGWSVIGVIVGPSKEQTHIARFLEYGTIRQNKRTGAASHIPAQPFLRPAWDSTSASIEADVTRGVRVVIDEARRG